MPLAVVERAAPRLVVQHSGKRPEKDARSGIADVLVEPGPQDPRDELVEARRVPPPIHVGFSDAEFSAGDRGPVEAVVVDGDIPGVEAVDRNAGSAQQGFCYTAKAAAHMLTS